MVILKKKLYKNIYYQKGKKKDLECDIFLIFSCFGNNSNQFQL